LRVTETTKRTATAGALVVLTIAAGVAYGYLLYLFLLAFAIGLVGIRPWWTGIAVVILPFLFNAETILTSPIGFVVIAALTVVYTWLGNEMRQQIVRRPGGKA
jgi:hypothetical protein